MTKIYLALLIVFSFSWANAALSPIAIDILSPVELPPPDFTITGVRLSALYGQQRNMYGIDLAGIGNTTDLAFSGIAASGLFNITKGTTNVILLQAAGAANINYQKTKVIGVQIAAVNYNNAESAIYGLELGPITNFGPHTTVGGIEVGIYNKAYEIYGLQIGVLNFATNLHGLQIGLLNFNDKGLFPVCPILNAGF